MRRALLFSSLIFVVLIIVGVSVPKTRSIIYNMFSCASSGPNKFYANLLVHPSLPLLLTTSISAPGAPLGSGEIVTSIDYFTLKSNMSKDSKSFPHPLMHPSSHSDVSCPMDLIWDSLVLLSSQNGAGRCGVCACVICH